MSKDGQIESYLGDLEAIPELPEEQIRHLIASRATAL
jgi:hypothetical protein